MQEMNAMLSIDPGSKGFLTLRHGDEFEFFAIQDGGMRDMAEKIIEWDRKYEMRAVMEEVHAVFGSSAKSTFAFGEINGYIKGILTALGIPYTTVQPKKWQLDIWSNQDKVKTTKNGKSVVDTKETSYNAARRLFPTLDLRRTDKCKKYDDNKVDSILIGEYGRRKNL